MDKSPIDLSKMQVCGNPNCGKPYRKSAINGLYVPDCDCGFVKEQQSKTSDDHHEDAFMKTYKASKIPPKYYNCSFDNIDPFNSDLISSARKWLECGLKERKSYYVQSPRGTGKSLINSIMGHECIRKRKSVYFTKPIRIYNHIFNPNLNSSEHIDFLKSVDVLIIDDFTKGVVNDWHKYVQFDILDERYENELVTIVNTWEMECDVEKKIGIDTVDRIREMCGEYYFKFDNLKNYRI